MNNNFTQTQRDMMRDDFIIEIKSINRLEKNNDEKLSLLSEFVDGYRKALTRCILRDLESTDIDILFDINNELKDFEDRLILIDPTNEEQLMILANNSWSKIIKITEDYASILGHPGYIYEG